MIAPFGGEFVDLIERIGHVLRKQGAIRFKIPTDLGRQSVDRSIDDESVPASAPGATFLWAQKEH
jgi:hypothetical protein